MYTALEGSIRTTLRKSITTALTKVSMYTMYIKVTSVKYDQRATTNTLNTAKFSTLYTKLFLRVFQYKHKLINKRQNMYTGVTYDIVLAVRNL